MPWRTCCDMLRENKRNKIVTQWRNKLQWFPPWWWYTYRWSLERWYWEQRSPSPTTLRPKNSPNPTTSRPKNDSKHYWRQHKGYMMPQRSRKVSYGIQTHQARHINHPLNKVLRSTWSLMKRQNNIMHWKEPIPASSSWFYLYNIECLLEWPNLKRRYGPDWKRKW